MSNHAEPDLAQINRRHYLFALLTAFANRMQAVGDAVFEEVTWKQWFALLGVSAFEGEPSISQVADLIGTSHQNVKQLLLRLQKAGFVRLAKDAADQRRVMVSFTERMAPFEQKYRADSAEFLTQMYQGISDQQVAQTLATLQRMDQNLRRVAASLPGKPAAAQEETRSPLSLTTACTAWADS